MTIREMLIQVTNGLAHCSFEDLKSEAQWLLAEVLEIQKSDTIIYGDRFLTEEQVEKVHLAMNRRKMGEPLSYIVGRRDFYGRTFQVGPGVLIPRPETELIVDLAKKHFRNLTLPLEMADWGAGSGCIGLTLLLEFPNSRLVSLEASAKAAVYLERNTKYFGCEKRNEQILKRVQDQTVGRRFDLIVANPPYIDPQDPEVAEDVKKFEPHEALFSANQGYQEIKDWLNIARKSLKGGGLLLMEIGSRQWENLKDEPWREWGFKKVEVVADLSDLPRVILAEML